MVYRLFGTNLELGVAVAQPQGFSGHGGLVTPITTVKRSKLVQIWRVGAGRATDSPILK